MTGKRKGPFKLNEFGVFEQPEEIDLELPKANDPKVSIEVAAHKGHWYAGYHVDMWKICNESFSCPVAVKNDGYSAKAKNAAIVLAIKSVIRRLIPMQTASARMGVTKQKILTQLYEHANHYEQEAPVPIELDATDVPATTVPAAPVASPAVAASSLLETLDNLLFDLEIEGDSGKARSSQLAWEMGGDAWRKGYRDTMKILSLAETSPLIAKEPADFLRGWLTAANEDSGMDPDEGFNHEDFESTEEAEAREGQSDEAADAEDATQATEQASAAGEKAEKATDADRGTEPPPPAFKQHVDRVVQQSAADRDHSDAIKVAQQEFCRTGLYLAQLAGEVKLAKRAHTEAAKELSLLLARGPERMPLFDRPPAAAPIEQANPPAPETEVDPPAALSGPIGEPRDWKTLPIEELKLHGLSKAIVEKLIENGVCHLGEFDGQRTYKAIGAAKRDKIADAFEAFWKANPEFTQADAPAKEEADDHGEDGSSSGQEALVGESKGAA